MHILGTNSEHSVKTYNYVRDITRIDDYNQEVYLTLATMRAWEDPRIEIINTTK